MLNPFLHLNTPEDVKAEFRKLAHVYHPDKGGTAENFRALRDFYLRRLKTLDGSQHNTEGGTTYTYKYDEAKENAVMEKLAELLHLLPATVEIYMIGAWLWIMGDTKPHKDTLKAAGAHWHSKRACWYWRPDEARSYRRSKGSLADIASRYGCKKFDGSKEEERRNYAPAHA